MTTNEIRKSFINYFLKQNHTIVKSDSLLRKEDPTLMFTNAGMNPFKAMFLGQEKVIHPTIANSQKCMRVSGKHNDLEDVGKDTYHHTFFEMLGNWSFGDYFKEKAIELAWDFLTNILKIKPENIYVTVFEGNKIVARDFETIAIWKKHIAEEHILLGNVKDNFWEMGETGPCGPCSEIHIDLREDSEKLKTSGKDLVNNDHPQVVEIWNLVFMEFLKKADGSLEKLPNKNIDTGMGLERLAMAVQNKKSTYDIDIFESVIKKISQKANVKYGKKEETDIAIRVISDHIRAICFCLGDGLLPSNNKEGYVLRRILRRAIRYGYSFLSFREPFLHELVSVLVTQYGDFYTEISKNENFIKKVILEEEKSFFNTLETGINRLNNYIETLEKSTKSVSGLFVFELYDTYGFPEDLTQVILSENNLSYNKKEFDKALDEQKNRARNISEKKLSDWIYLSENMGFDFIGYDSLECNSHLLAYRKVIEKNKTYYQLIFKETPFYAESGGQVGDKGEIYDGTNTFRVFNTKKENDLWVHYVEKFNENNNPKTLYSLKVDSNTRTQIELHHSATHLLHYALQKVLGEHIEQKGSFVNDSGLRFDFSHFQKISPEEIQKIEETVKDLISQGTECVIKNSMPYTDAIKQGAKALFNEKYGDSVRVVQFGNSIELCGGTHTKNTSNLIDFKITKESSSSAGIRRVEAIVGKSYMQYLKANNEVLQQIYKTLQIQNNPIQVVEKLKKDLEEKNKKTSQLQKIFLDQDFVKIKEQLAQKKSLIYLQSHIDASTTKNLLSQVSSYSKDDFVLIIKTEHQLFLSSYGTASIDSLHNSITTKIKGIKGGGSPTQKTYSISPDFDEKTLKEIL